MCSFKLLIIFPFSAISKIFNCTILLIDQLFHTISLLFKTASENHTMEYSKQKARYSFLNKAIYSNNELKDLSTPVPLDADKIIRLVSCKFSVPFFLIKYKSLKDWDKNKHEENIYDD
jgi:hypothetical protein